MDDFVCCNNSQAVFDEAEKFFWATRILDNNISIAKDYKHLNLEVISYVNHAYSIELYLKCLQVIDLGGFFKGHHLLSLFDNLNSDTKERIKLLYHETELQFPYGVLFLHEENPDTLIDILSELHTPFVDFRYNFNNQTLKPYKLKEATNCIRAVILEKDKSIKQKLSIF